MVASHNDLQARGHIPDFPDQQAITAFLRGLLRDGRTQVSWASEAGIPYNSFTNWFTSKPPAMSAESLLRVVKAAGAEADLADWLRTFGDVAQSNGGGGLPPTGGGTSTKPVQPVAPSPPEVTRKVAERPRWPAGIVLPPPPPQQPMQGASEKAKRRKRGA